MVHKVTKADRADLRRRAEEQLRECAGTEPALGTEKDPLKLQHELQVHQIELEMQNEELRQARDKLEVALEQYTDLYDFAPVGYFTLDHTGAIKAVNLSGASICGIERTRLLGRRFGEFLPINARPFFADFLGKVFARHGKESCEMPFTKEGNRPLFVQVEAMADASDCKCLIAVIDITDRRLAETELAAKKLKLEEINKSLGARITKGSITRF